MESTRCLREEHQIILKVVDCFDIALRIAKENNSFIKEVFEPFIEFFQGFADKCHHCKEENRLFPKMEEKGIPRNGGPIGIMVMEHQQARDYIKAIESEVDKADAGDANACNLILEQGRAFNELMRAHIDKEDHCLFGMAESIIQGNDLTELTVQYKDEESEPDYVETYKRCTAIAEQLQQQYTP